MNKYKIIEDRPELTAEKVEQGMDFNSIKQKSLSLKRVNLKSRIIKCVLGLVIIGSGILVYKLIADKIFIKNNVILKNENKNHKLIRNSIAATSVNTQKQKTYITKNSEPVLAKNKNLVIINKRTLDSTGNEKKQDQSFVFYKPKRCVILLPSHCCYCIPGTSKFARNIDSLSLKFEQIECDSMYKIKDVSCIWLRLITKENSYLKLEDQLKNFALCKGKDKELYPLAIKVTDDPKLWGANFKGKAVKINYNKEIDVLLFFKNSDPKIGGKIRINKRIATITK